MDGNESNISYYLIRGFFVTYLSILGASSKRNGNSGWCRWSERDDAGFHFYATGWMPFNCTRATLLALRCFITIKTTEDRPRSGRLVRGRIAQFRWVTSDTVSVHGTADGIIGSLIETRDSQPGVLLEVHIYSLWTTVTASPGQHLRWTSGRWFRVLFADKSRHSPKMHAACIAAMGGHTPHWDNLYAFLIKTIIPFKVSLRLINVGCIFNSPTNHITTGTISLYYSVGFSERV